MGPRFAALVLAATALSSVARAQAVPPSYTDIVNVYRAGGFAAAVKALHEMSYEPTGVPAGAWHPIDAQ